MVKSEGLGSNQHVCLGFYPESLYLFGLPSRIATIGQPLESLRELHPFRPELSLVP
jgi:hypothetical protein